MDKEFSRQERRFAYSLNHSLVGLVNEEGMERTFGEKVKPTVKNINAVLASVFSGNDIGLRQHFKILKNELQRVYKEFLDLASQQPYYPNNGPSY